MPDPSSPSDPLDLIRHAIRTSHPPTFLDVSYTPTSSILNCTTLSFSPSTSTPINIPSSTPTRYTISPGSAETFTVQQIWYVYQERETDASGYLRKAGGAKMRYVPVVERGQVLAYLIKGELPVGRILVKGSKPEDGQFEAAPTTTTRQKYAVDEADKRVVEKIRATQIALGDKYDSLRITPGGKKQDWTSLRHAIMSERVKPLKELIRKQEEEAARHGARAGAGAGEGERGLKRSSSSASAGVGTDQNRAKKQRSTQQNILLLSSSPTALVNMWNVKRFLEEGVFEQADVAKARQQAEGNKKMDDVIVVYRSTRAPNGEEKKLKYYAIDNLEVLTKLAGSAQGDPWDRVLCVVTTGQAWQFKSYKWPEPRSLFNHVRGVHFHFASDGPHPAVKDWKVRQLGIEKNQRHKDRPVSAAFWNALESPLAIGGKR